MSYSSEQEYYQNIYLNGAVHPRDVKAILSFSRQMLGKATIIQNLVRAKPLSRLHDHHLHHEHEKEWPTADYGEIMQETYRVLMSFYEHMLDEVAIVSAFEMYAKAVFLDSRRVIHVIARPNSLRKRQKGSPITFEDVRREYANFGDFAVFPHTLSAFRLLDDGYNGYLGLSASTITRLKEFNSVRNRIHFHRSRFYQLTVDDLAALEELRDQISTYE